MIHDLISTIFASSKNVDMSALELSDQEIQRRETLDKLRKTRDTLNDIVTENDQLKIEVSKY